METDLTEAQVAAAVAQDESVPGSGPGGVDEDFADIGQCYTIKVNERYISLITNRPPHFPFCSTPSFECRGP